MADAIDAVRAQAVNSLLGHEGIVGVGRSERSLVVFVSDRSVAKPIVDEWVRDHDVKIELREVGTFRPAEGS